MLLNAVCFFAPLSIALQIDVGSQIFAAELLLPCIALVVYLTSKSCDVSRHATILVQLALAYFVAQILSDVWNQSSYEQYSRGWARILLFSLNVVSIYIVIGNKRSKLLIFCIGFALGRIWITYYGFEGDGIPWKIGLAKPVALLAIVFWILMPGIKGANIYMAAIIIFVLGVFDIAMDFRSHGAVLIAVAVLLMSSAIVRTRFNGSWSGGIKPIIGMFGAGLIAALVAFQVYVYAAESGWLTENASQKYKTQVQNTDAPLLVAGRSEMLVYFEAIIDSIFIGHGSWPRNLHYAERLAAERYERQLSRHAGGVVDDSIPLHSHIFGSWIEAGIAGGMFWLSLIVMILKSLCRSFVGKSHMRPLYLYGAILLLWDILFSPFSGFRRLETALLIVIVLRSLLQRQSLQKVPARSQGRKRRRRHRRRPKARTGGFDTGEAAANAVLAASLGKSVSKPQTH